MFRIHQKITKRPFSLTRFDQFPRKIIKKRRLVSKLPKDVTQTVVQIENIIKPEPANF